MDDNGDQKKQTKNRINLPGFGDIFQSFWIRHPFRNNNEMDKFLLAYCFNFLLPFGCFLWALLFFIKG